MTTDYPIVWAPAEPNNVTFEIEDDIVPDWILKAVPDPAYGGVEPEPIITSYEILENNLNPASIIVDETNIITGVVVTGDAGNPFAFQKIGYVSPKYTGHDITTVTYVAELPEYNTLDLFAFIPSSEVTKVDTITIRAYATGAETEYIDGVFTFTTTNNLDKVSDTLEEIIST